MAARSRACDAPSRLPKRSLCACERSDQPKPLPAAKPLLNLLNGSSWNGVIFTTTVGALLPKSERNDPCPCASVKVQAVLRRGEGELGGAPHRLPFVQRSKD
jgi:hypothetical protein